MSALSDTGHDVAILDRSGEFAVDLADEHAVREIAARLGPRDVLVHAAAAFDRAALADIDAASWRRVQPVNLEAALWLCQQLTPAMIERGFGRIVFIASNNVCGGLRRRLFCPRWSARRAWWDSPGPLGAHGITVNCVAPGLTRTRFTEADLPEEAFEEVLVRRALPRSLIPEDTAAVVAFLASDGALAVTGQTLTPDGGSVLQ